MSNRLALKHFNIQSFAGISKSNPIVISFADNERTLKLEGDQGTKKTSTLEALKSLLSANMAPNAINSIDQDKKATARFVANDGLLYQAKITKTTFVLENIVTDENGEIIKDDKGNERTRAENKPATMIRTLVGPLGISPMRLKDKKPAEQIEWLQTYGRLSEEETKKKEKEIRTKADKAYSKRTTVNRNLKNLEIKLNANDYFKRKDYWENELKKISEIPDLQAQVEAKKNAGELYVRAEEKHTNQIQSAELLDTDIKRVEETIARLQLQLTELNTQKTELTEKIEIGKKYLEDNKTVKQEYSEATEKLNLVKALEVDKAKFDTVLAEVATRDELISEQKKLNEEIEESDKELADFIKSFAPDIPDFEVKFPTEEDPREGLYYQGKTIDQLCESELWEMCLQIWAAYGVKIVFVENIYDLGSNAVERLNWFVENGGYVFATQMDRAEKNIRISINTKID